MIYDLLSMKERLFQRPYLNGLINLNRPFDTRSNSSLVPLGFPCRCLYKNALYVPFPKPGQAFIKSLHENGSEREPFLTASIIALYTRCSGISCLYKIALSPLPLLRSHIDSHLYKVNAWEGENLKTGGKGNEATDKIGNWIEVYYNKRYVHSGLGHRSPEEFEELYLSRLR